MVIRLNQSRSKNSVNTNSFVNTEINQSNRLLPSGDINKILSVAEQFDKERNSSSKYRFIFTISATFTNVLMDTGDDDTDMTLKYFGNDIFMLNEDGDTIHSNIEDSISTNMVEKNGWFGYYTPPTESDAQCTLKVLHPNQNMFDLTPVDGIDNWLVYLSYPKDIDNTQYVIKNGIVVISTGVGTVGGKQLKLIRTPIKHGLSLGEDVNINSVGYKVLRLGDDSGNAKEYSFVVDVSSDDTTINDGSRIKRVVAGFESEYYFRKFETITEVNDYELYPLAFSTNLYGDKKYQLIFDKDIDVSQYVDCKNRPLSEIFLTFIKKNDERLNSDGDEYQFGDVKTGLDIPFTIKDENLGDVHRITDDASNTDIPYETNGLAFGDIVEYNEVDALETVLCEVSHRFNTTNRVNNGRQEGYYYKPHHRVKIRDWSTFVEQGDITTGNLPSYAVELSDGSGQYLWRDLLDIGVNDGQETVLDYPFLNGSHYMHTNITLNLKRQDPFGNYGLYCNESPKDVYGVYASVDDVKKVGETDGCCK